MLRNYEPSTHMHETLETIIALLWSIQTIWNFIIFFYINIFYLKKTKYKGNTNKKDKLEQWKHNQCVSNIGNNSNSYTKLLNNLFSWFFVYKKIVVRKVRKKKGFL